MTVFNWLEKLCMYVPDKIALKEFETGRTLTYRQLDNISNRLARQFTADLGIARGDRIALYADSCLEHFILFFVAQKTGAIIVPLNYRLAAKEIHQVLLDCTPKLLITEEKYLPNVAQFPLPASITHQWTLQELQQAGYAQRDLPESFTPCSLDEDDAVFILYTSGTTGLPKGVLYSHKMLFWNSINTTMRLDMTADERTVCVLPLFHTGGLNALSTPLLHRGAYSA
jgi:Acyl-CoA synthetases (AMP-forming)/AMP-acid ligases II